MFQSVNVYRQINRGSYAIDHCIWNEHPRVRFYLSYSHFRLNFIAFKVDNSSVHLVAVILIIPQIEIILSFFYLTFFSLFLGKQEILDFMRSNKLVSLKNLTAEGKYKKIRTKVFNVRKTMREKRESKLKQLTVTIKK